MSSVAHEGRCNNDLNVWSIEGRRYTTCSKRHEYKTDDPDVLEISDPSEGLSPSWWLLEPPWVER